MNERPSPDKGRMDLAEKIVHSELEHLVAQVTAGIRALPLSSRHERADAGLVNIWEEFKYQFQMVNSTYTDFYEADVRKLCADTVASLPPRFQQLLWLWTDEFLELWMAQDEVALSNWYRSALADVLYRMVCEVANNEPLAFDPGEEESRLEHELDSQWFREQLGDG